MLTGAVTRLDRARQGQRVRLEAEVSVVVVERPGGQMRALLTGRAISTLRVPRSAAEANQQERGVIGAAVTEVMDRLWTTMTPARR
jgi:ATP-dependent protease Clp ATPase subunit